MTSDTPALQPITPAYHTQILEDAQLDTLQSATLEILEQVGIHCPSEKALEDILPSTVRWSIFPASWLSSPVDVVLEAMSHAPRFYTMGARLPAFDLHSGWEDHVLRHRWLRGGDHRFHHPSKAAIEQG